ncbi:hypothetical protein ACF0H5_020446 [Mactra antiquata]
MHVLHRVTEMMGDDTNIDTSGGILHRRKRDLSWDDVETFYEDKNNFAMYLVLPIIVLVYGGCAVIYCIARCRRYLRRRRKKPHQKREIIEDEPTDEPQTTHIPSVPVSRNPNGNTTHRGEGASSSSDVRVSVERDAETPLPWQVPANGAAVVTAVPPRSDRKKTNAFNNRGYENDYEEKKQPPPPSYDEMYQPNRPMSKPPPYEEKGIRHRRGSVEEIITLEAPKNDTPEFNDRKRKRPGSRASSRQSATKEIDAEREKARQLVRGDRQRREPPPVDRDSYRQKTPDIISHARTQPLKPQYKPTHNDPKAEATLMAKQAAQLLRLDQQGRHNGQKAKRLVFVAE